MRTPRCGAAAAGQVVAALGFERGCEARPRLRRDRPVADARPAREGPRLDAAARPRHRRWEARRRTTRPSSTSSGRLRAVPAYAQQIRSDRARRAERRRARLQHVWVGGDGRIRRFEHDADGRAAAFARRQADDDVPRLRRAGRVTAPPRAQVFALSDGAPPPREPRRGRLRARCAERASWSGEDVLLGVRGAVLAEPRDGARDPVVERHRVVAEQLERLA